MARAIAAKKDLDDFVAEVGRLLETGTFAMLPDFQHRDIILPGLRHLTVGRWRGIFLVEPGGEEVVALLFTREPHEVGPLLAFREERDPEGK